MTDPGSSQTEADSRRQRRVVGAVLALSLAVVAGCGGFRPYRAMAKAASSEESVMAQASDHRLKAQLREALLAADPSENIHITPYVFMAHAYLVGFVAGEDQREKAVAAANRVEGLRSLETYLPDRPANAGTEEAASDVGLKAEVKAAIALLPGEVSTRIENEVLDGHVVLLGVVKSQEAADEAVSAIQKLSSVSGVTNFLLVPEAEYERLRPGIR